MNYNRTIKGDTKDKTEGNNVCYKKTNKEELQAIYVLAEFSLISNGTSCRTITVTSNRPRSARSSDFVITRPITL